MGLIRQDAAHVLAQVAQELFPGSPVTIKPVIENGYAPGNTPVTAKSHLPGGRRRDRHIGFIF